MLENTWRIEGRIESFGELYDSAVILWSGCCLRFEIILGWQFLTIRLWVHELYCWLSRRPTFKYRNFCERTTNLSYQTPSLTKKTSWPQAWSFNLCSTIKWAINLNNKGIPPDKNPENLGGNPWNFWLLRRQTKRPCNKWIWKRKDQSSRLYR